MATPFAVNKGRVFNKAVTNDNDIFGGDLTASDLVSGTKESSAFRLTISVDTDTLFRVHFNDGSNEVNASFNNGAVLVAGRLYTFVHEVREDDSINYQLSISATINVLYISEVRGESI